MTSAAPPVDREASAAPGPWPGGHEHDARRRARARERPGPRPRRPGARRPPRTAPGRRARRGRSTPRRGDRSGTGPARCRRRARRPRRPASSRAVSAGPWTSTQSIRSLTSSGTDSERPGRGPREPGHRDRVRMHLSVGVAEPRIGQSLGDRPDDRVADLLADRVDRGGPVEVRRGVEVAGEEHGHPVVGQTGEDVELPLDRGQARRALEVEHRAARLAVAHPVRAVRIGRQVDVRDRDEPSRGHLGEGVGAVRAREDRSAGSERSAGAAARSTSRAWSASTHSFAVPSCRPTMSGSAASIVETTCPMVSGQPAASVHHWPVSRFHSSPP